MPTGREIMERAGVLLLDEEHIRWPLSELCDWINQGVRAIVLAKPSASTPSRIIQLAVGPLQKVPADGDPTPLMLVRIVRNLKNQNEPREGGRIVTPTDRATLDAQVPNWHDRLDTPFRKEVRQYVYDEANPLEFYAYPGNDGTGIAEAIVSTLPAKLVASGDATLVESYEGSIGLPEPYSVPILDYVLYRSQMKDDLAGNAGRAGSHYQQFATAIGLKIQVEGATSPNARR